MPKGAAAALAELVELDGSSWVPSRSRAIRGRTDYGHDGQCHRPPRPRGRGSSAWGEPGERRIWHCGGMQRFEYRVVQLRESLVGGKLSADKLEEILNDEARKGWMVKAITSAEVKGRVGPGGVDGLLVTFERPVA